MADYNIPMPVRIENNPNNHATPVRVEIIEGTILVDKNGNEIDVFGLIRRIEALETALMERFLLGTEVSDIIE